MKIFRHLDQAGKMGFGRFDEEGKTYLIVQKPDGSFEATDQAITPFQLLTPIDFRCIMQLGTITVNMLRKLVRRCPSIL